MIHYAFNDSGLLRDDICPLLSSLQSPSAGYCDVLLRMALLSHPRPSMDTRQMPRQPANQGKKIKPRLYYVMIASGASSLQHRYS